MRTAAVAIAALIVGAGPVLALDGPGRALLPSPNNIGASNDAVITGAAGDGVRRGFIPPYSGLVKVQWEVRSSDGGEVGSFASVQHLSGCNRTSVATSFAVKSCNIRVAAGMPVEIGASPQDNTTQVSLRNVRLYYRVVDSDGQTIVYDDLPVILDRK